MILKATPFKTITKSFFGSFNFFESKTAQMKQNVLYILILVLMSSAYSNAQSRGVRIGYIDTEYILEKIPEYQEAMSQLDNKVQEWQAEIQTRLSEIEQKRKDLSNEKALLTKELVEEREEDIAFEEKEILDYQQKRFGPNGDLMLQKMRLMQPIQDQIFAAVQDIAAGRQYDFIFDKSSDAVMLYSEKRFDLSEQVLRSINRTSRRTQAETRAEIRAAEEEELIPEINEELEAREKAQEEKREERESAIEKRRQEILAEREARKKEVEERRQKILEEREKERQARIDARNNKTSDTEAEEVDAKNTNSKQPPTEVTETKTRAQLIEENRQKKLAEREAMIKARDSINN